MRKNKFFIAGLVTVFVALVSLTLVSSTWAKYASTVSGQDSAKVALWAWEYTDDGSDGILVNLFNDSAVYELNGAGEPTSTPDEEVKQGSALIAPGTGGEYTFTVTNNSEVDAKAKFDFTVSGASVPLQFRVKTNEGTYSDWENSLANVDFTDVDMEETMTVTVQWRWEFKEDGSTSATDTPLGEAAGDVFVDVLVTFEQRD